jgi:predicted ester cyclase
MEATAVHAGTGVGAAFLEDWAARYLAVWLAHDVEGIVAMCTEDVIWDDPALPETYHGHDGLRRFIEAVFSCFPDVEIEELEPAYTSPTGPRALAPYRFTATMLGPWEPTDLAPTGRRVSFEGIDQWEFRGDRMCRYDTKYDLLGVARQMGVIPPQGSAGDRVMARVQHLQARFQRRRAARSRA